MEGKLSLPSVLDQKFPHLDGDLILPVKVEGKVLESLQIGHGLCVVILRDRSGEPEPIAEVILLTEDVEGEDEEEGREREKPLQGCLWDKKAVFSCVKRDERRISSSWVRFPLVFS